MLRQIRSLGSTGLRLSLRLLAIAFPPFLNNWHRSFLPIITWICSSPMTTRRRNEESRSRRSSVGREESFSASFFAPVACARSCAGAWPSTPNCSNTSASDLRNPATEELAEMLSLGPTGLVLRACHDGQRQSIGRLPSRDLNRRR